MNTKTILREFISENFLFGNGQALEDDTNLFENGIIDSTGIIELISFLEMKFKISIEDEELITDNFSNLNSIGLFLQRKTAVINN